MKQAIQYNHNQTLSYAIYGKNDGFPILVQHGLIAGIKNGALFQQLIDLGARVICIARPGYGDSSPYELKDMAGWGSIVSVLVDELELSRFDVLGISSGAPYGYSIGYRLPEKTRNIYILSGTPALFDEKVLSFWPYPVKRDASLAEMQLLAFELFFSNLSEEDLEDDDIRDSMMNNCFGIAQDLRIRSMDWGFKLSDLKPPVIMRHSPSDNSVPFVTAEITSQLLQNCRLDIRENDAHFSKEILDDFIRTVISGYIGRD